MTAITARQILALLAEKHAKDVFVPEVKDGPTWGHGCLRLDAWAMVRSWSPLTTFGYEIKVSRGDWLRDTKWTEYVPLTHLFTVVAPKGIVLREELPPGVGLLEVAANGARLWTRQKPVRREIELPSDLLCYLLMSRARITKSMYDDGETRGEQWSRLAREDRKRLAEIVNGLYRERHAAEIKRHDELERRVRRAETIELAARECGIEITAYWLDQEVRRKLQSTERQDTARYLQEIGQRCAKLASDLLQEPQP